MIKIMTAVIINFNWNTAEAAEIIKRKNNDNLFKNIKDTDNLFEI